jgi:hypothetical protein
LAACNNGEICFQLFWDGFMTSDFQRHFYWNDWNHSNDLAGSPSMHNAYYIVDRVQGVWNRDTECNLALYDWDAAGNPVAYTVLPQGFPMGNWGAQRNNAHSRCW